MDDYRTLLEGLDGLVALLGACGESHWAAWLDADRRQLRRRDSGALDHLLGAFGGMGSLSDLVIDPINGHTVEANRVGEVNQTLSRLRSVVYETALRMRRSLDT